MNKRRVVITGLGAVSPLGNDVQSTWSSVLSGQSGIAEITRFDASAFSAKIAGEVKNFDVSPYLDPKEAKKQDLFSQYAVAAAGQSLQDAGITTESYDPARMGCVLGVGIGGLGTIENNHATYLKSGPRRISPFLVPRMISNLAPGNVAIKFGLKGVNFTVTSACTSATHAVGEAYRMVAHGVQDLILSGGTESTVSPIGIGGFCSMKALSTRNDEPTKASRPFDKDRDGFVLGEGAALLVLETLENAQQRGAKIYAEVVGYGSSCDAFHITAPSEGGEGAVACMSEALKDSGLAQTDITYINAHGTSTPANDSTESLAIEKVFGDYSSNGLQVSSTKSMTGHLLGAAGAIEALFCILSISEGKIPPTINLDNPDPECRLDYVPHKARECAVKAAMSNSFGFGGTNASVVFAEVG